LSPKPIGLSLVLTPDAMAVGEGRVIAGRYRVIERIGAGTLGLVVLAEDRQTGRRVALKILMPRLTDDPNDPHGQRILLAAAEDAAAIRHAGAVPILGTYVERVAGGPSVILVMEHQAVPSLRTVLDVRGAIPAAEARDMVDAVADVVEAAHRQGILHLDLKPNNVFPRRSSPGEPAGVAVVDFGLLEGARACDGRSLSQVGDPEWAAPEVMQHGNVDDRADVFGLGALLEEMLGNDGQVPKDCADPALHERLLAVVERASAEHASDRYADVATFRAALFDEPVRAVEEPITEAIVRRRASPLIWATVAGSVLALGLLCGVGSLVLMQPGAAPKAAAPATVGSAPPAAGTPAPAVEEVEPGAGSGTEAGDAGDASPDEVVVTPVVHRVPLTSDPAAAEVWVDGKLLGVTPVDVPVPEGETVSVTLRRAGFVVKTVDVSAGEQPDTVALRRVPREVAPDRQPTSVPKAKELILER
jgi:serine/threonine-protein kinase